MKVNITTVLADRKPLTGRKFYMNVYSPDFNTAYNVLAVGGANSRGKFATQEDALEAANNPHFKPYYLFTICVEE